MSVEGPGDQVAAVYRGCADRIVALVSGLSDEQLARPVPATPKWTVIELLAHLVGGPADVLAGRLDGVATPPWTQAQVEARRGRPVGELLAEWAAIRDGIDALCRSGAVPAISFDVATHEQDLRGALSARRIDDPVALEFVAAGFFGRTSTAIAAAGLPPLRLTGDTDWSVGDAAGAALSAPTFELFRLLAGRRSARQARAMGWNVDPSPYLDVLCPLGPLRESDLVE